MADDIVAELDGWLAAWTLPGAPKAQLMDALQRARDEIVRLRTLYAVADREARDYSAEIVALRALR